MALAEGMKNLVNGIKASKRARRGFVKGNREQTKALREENRRYLGEIHAQNQSLALQTKEFLKSAKAERAASFKQLKDGIDKDLDIIHQSVGAIRSGAKGYLKELREDATLAHKYWQSLSVDNKPVGEEKPASVKPEPENKPKEKTAEPESSSKSKAGESKANTVKKDDNQQGTK